MTLRRFQTLLGNAVSDASSPSDGRVKGRQLSKSRRARNERRSKWQTADRRLNHETLEKRELLAAEVVAIRPDAGALISDGDTLRNTPREINLLFNGNANLVESSIDGNVRLVRAGGDGTFGDGNEVEVSLGYLGLETPGDTSLEGRQRIVMRPASNAIHNATDPSASLPDDTYRIEITASLQSEEAGGNVAFNEGVDFASVFTLDRAAQVTAVVPQPVQRTNTTPLNPRGTLTQQSNVVEVYFDNQTLDLNDAQDVTLYRLIDMDDAAASPLQPQSAVYDDAANLVTLTFSSDLPEGNFRLDLGEEFISQGPMVVGNGNDDANSSIDSPGQEATNLGALSPDGIRVSSQLTGQDVAIPPYVGSQDEPGHRQIQREAHIGAAGTDLTVPQEIRNVGYHFPLTLGTDFNGNTYPNLITETQREIVRKIMDVYASVSGYEFVEVEEDTPSAGLLMIGNGDFRAVSPSLGPNDGVAGLANGSFAMVNGSIYDQATNFYGDGFTNVMMHEIGHSLGLGHSYEIPSVMGASLPNDVLPGDHDVVHLQRITPPNNTDIDMYGFQLPEPGKFTAETFAQRLPLASSLSTVLTLYKRDGTSLELVAQNDRYFGDDSFLDLSLEAGEYFLGVTSTGNDNYDPRIADSGYGGKTGGIGFINSSYELELTFKADSIRAMRDASGTPIDGDRDGNAGGVYSFYFQTSDPDAALNTTIFVDRLNDPTVNAVDGDGSFSDPFDTISAALDKAGNRIIVPLDISELDAADSFSVSLTVAGNPDTATFLFDGVSLPNTATNANDLAADVANAINARFSPGTATAIGRTVELTSIDSLDISGSETLLRTPNIIRILGNDFDGDPSTTNDLVPYLIGNQLDGSDLRDGGEFRVPQGATAMVDAGVLFKMRRSNLDTGSSSIDINRAGGALQLLGTPDTPVWMRSFFDDSFGGNSGSIGQVAGAGDFGGIVMRDDSDLEDYGIFLNYVSHADIRHGGGKVFVDSSEESFTPIHLTDARPALAFNTITDSQGVGAISASPDSFDDQGGRIGPEVVGNFLRNNSRNGLFVRIETNSNAEPTKLNVPGRFNDTDIPHLISENLIIAGNPGGRYVTETGDLLSRASGRLMIDPGIVLKLDGVRIEAEAGGSTLIAEGTENLPVIFTSLNDDRYGGSGVFDTTNTPDTVGSPGDWGGIYFGFTSQGSIDNAIVTFGGGQESTTQQGSDGFNAIEIHQADVRIANSLITNNADGNASGTRAGLGANQAATIYVRGAQPVIVNNRFVENAAAAININANSLKSEINVDPGRMTGFADRFEEFDDNVGPLIRLNQMDDNTINGMLVRGEVLTTESSWDDTDIVHVLTDEIIVGNHHSFSGLTLKSSGSESLVVKLSGSNAGFTATGSGLDIVDRIGGTVTVLGAPGFPVVLTSLQDDSVGAGFAPDGSFVVDTNNDGLSLGVPGQWRGLQFDEYSNDRNVGFALERETPLTSGKDINRTNASGQFLGSLAPDYKSGDENNRLGFEVQGFISPDDPTDVDVYSFEGIAGTEVWIDIDRTDNNLDAVVELLNAAGNVVARSVDGFNLADPDNLLPISLSAGSLTQNDLRGGDFYSQNYRDPGMFLRLPGTAGQTARYFLRVRSRPSVDIGYLDGESRGRYQLQVRLQQEDEFPGSTVRFADIRYATTAIDVQGLPNRSLLTGEVGEVVGGGNDTFDTAQPLINVLESDRALLSIAGVLGNEDPDDRDVDVDWFAIDADTVGVQVIEGVNDGAGTVAVVFDMDYADKANRADTTVAVFDSNGQLIFVGRESNIEDDQPAPGQGADIDDLSRGSLGDKDPYIGPVHITPGETYYVAVMGNGVTPNALMQFYQDTAGGDANYTDNDNRYLRLEPINSVQRVVEDHLGFSGYNSRGSDNQPVAGQIFDLADPVTHLPGLPLADVPVFIASDRPIANADDQLYLTSIFEDGSYDFAVSGNNWQPNSNDIQDIVIRSDGRMFGYLRVTGDDANVGQLVEINPADGTTTPVRLDGIPGVGTTPNARDLSRQIGTGGVFDPRADEFTNSDEVDALTVERTGSASATPTYDYYYSVRESDGSSKLYRANGDGNATPTAADGGDINNPSSVKYGLMGNINVEGTALLDFGGNNQIKVFALNGDDFDITFVRTAQPTSVLAANTVARTATINIDRLNAPTMQQIVDLINNHPILRQIAFAQTESGSGGATGANDVLFPSPINNSQSLSDAGRVQFDDGTNQTTVLLVSRSDSDFDVTITRGAGPTGITFISSATRSVWINLSTTTLASAQDFVDTINTDPAVTQFVTARIASGSSTNVGSISSPPAGTVLDSESADRVQFSDGSATANVVIHSLDGNSFNFSLDRNLAGDSIVADPVLRTVTVNLDRDARPTPQQLIDLIQADANASSFLNAYIEGDANLVSDIQGSPAPQALSVENLAYAYTTLTVRNNANPVAETVIRIKSTLPGVDGDFTLNVSRPGTNTAASVFSANVATRTINLRIGSQNGNGPTAAAIVDAINNHDQARQLVTAVIVGGNANGNGDGNNGTAANSLVEGAYINGMSDGLEGVVTGLAFDNPVTPTSMFGVTDGGEFVQINPSTGDATLLWKDLGYEFSALTLGPQSAESGRYRDVYFATTKDLRVVAFEFDAALGTWELAPVFDGVGASAFETQLSDIPPSNADSPVGLAFSPLDINLWHPTTRRGNEIGHGINEAPDGSRAPSDVPVVYEGVNPNGTNRNFTQAEGGASFYFGLEEFIESGSFNQNTEGYFTYDGVNAQYGLSENLHRDLISNAGAVNTYALAGGAQGSLVSNEFSLAGSVAEDRPTLYVNYFLETENHQGQDYDNTDDPFRDSARILASTDGGLTWNLVATNNSQLSAADPQDANQAELPGFISHLADAGVNSSGPRTTAHQVVQELFDNTGTWRQVRVDLSDYAGQDVRLRFDFSTAGRIAGDGVDDAIGDLSDEEESIRTKNNQFEGFYIDDIIVGYAERGEMATVPSQVVDEASLPANVIRDINTDAGTFQLLTSNRFSNSDPDRNPEVYNGAYQLEVRRTGEYAALTTDGITVTSTYDTNDRHIIDVSETAAETFETGSFAIAPADLSLGNLDIAAADLTSFEATSDDPYTGARSLQAGDTSGSQYSYWQTSVSSLGSSSTQPGIIEFAVRVSSAEHLHGLRFYINGTPQILSHAHGEENPTLDELQLASGEYFYRKVQFQFPGGDNVFTWLYDQSAGGATGGENTAFIDDIRLLQGGTGLPADKNVQRQQGMFIIDSNTITGSSDFGVSVGPGVAAQTGVSEPGSVINFPQQNTGRLVPGVVIVNNVIAGESAIEFAGENNALPNRPVPFGRITNNTLVGTGSGVGVDVVGLAAPTLLNNIFFNFDQAIAAEGFNLSNSVSRSNYFQANGNNGLEGSDATIETDANAPLFVDATAGNYYLVDGAGPLDNSLEILPDRLNFVSFKNELGISISNIVAPERDVYGQLRTDSGQSGGGGAQVFIDQGAIDRADGDQPYAVLLQPIDNDNSGNDLDPNQTVVQLDDPILDAFSILIGDGRGENAPFEGTGINPATINNGTVSVRRNNVELIEGVDYILGFNASTGELRLVPLSSLWQPNSVYEVLLDNQTIADRAGNSLRPNRTDGTTAFTIILPTVQMDYGDAPDSYGTLLGSDGARHAIINDGSVRFGNLIDNELDSDILYGRSDDDTPALVLNPSAGLLGTVFTVTASGAGVSVLGINSVPSPGDTLEVFEPQGDQVRYEFILAGTAAAEGNVGVLLDPAGSTDDFAQALQAAIANVFVDFGGDIAVEFEAADAGAGLPSSLTLSKFDDEDGIGIGRLQIPGNTPALPAVEYRVFYDPNEPQEDFTDPTLVLGYLNPQDQRGASLILHASTDGFVDAWIDFDGNTVFDPATETILDSVPVVAGRNEFTIYTPENTSDKLSWARFRISPNGNATPTGLVIGGEVEDYQVSIVNVDLPQPVNDSYVVNEDEVLDSSTLGSNQSVFGNDTFDAAQFMPVTAVVVDGPTYGTLILDPITGEFVYDSFVDFAGIDTFTYRLYDQATGAAGPANDVMGNPIGYGTVTINVDPVNDKPSVDNLTLLAIEDTDQIFTAEQLIASASGDGMSEFTLTLSDGSIIESPWDESTQTFHVISLETSHGIIHAGSPNQTEGLKTPRGRIFPSWNGNNLEEFVYRADQDLNEQNDNGDVPLTDQFTFTIVDDGVLVNPGEDLVDPADDIVFTGSLQQAEATANISVKPKNDAPVASDDLISENNVAWNAFFIGPDPTNPVAQAPVPTEDSELVIPAAYLILNDQEARDSANDENDNLTDDGLTVTDVSATSFLGGSVTLNANGDIVFNPADNTYGEDWFTYTVTDSGITFDLGLEGMPGSMPAPLSHTATVRILIKPVNDTPQANDLALDLLEYRENEDGTGGANPDPKSDGVGFRDFSKDDLLRLGGAGSALEVTPTPSADFPADFDEDAQDLRVIKIGLPDLAGASIDARLLTYDAVTGLAPVQTLATARGTLSLTFSLVPDPANPGSFLADSGEFASGTYEPNVDYNEEEPFAPAATTDLFTYFVEDFSEIPVPGAGNFPGESLNSVGHGSLTSEAATVTMTTHATNDTPEFPVFNTVTFAEDINDTGDAFNTVFYDIYEEALVADYDPADPSFDTEIFVAPATALDERLDSVQSLSFSYNAVSVPNGMFASNPVLDKNGVLTLTPLPNAYGYAVFEITVSDDGKSYDVGDDPRSVTRTLTVHITPVNDAPVAFDRELEIDEAVEYSDGTLVEPPTPAFIDLAPEEFLGRAAVGQELAEPSDFTDDVDTDDEFDEEEQNLRVVQFTVTLQDGSSVDVHAAQNNGVELQLRTGRITFDFDSNGAYTGGIYYPSEDYNQETPFAANEQFTYIVEDFGPTTIPGSLAATGTTEQVDYTTVGGVGSNNRSEPKTMTLVTRAKNDEPEFPAFNTVTFAEDINDAGDAFNTVFYNIYTEALVADYDPTDPNFEQAIFVGPETALDERLDSVQTLSFSYSAVSVPNGMFDSDPVLDENGVLTLTPLPDAYGYAVFEITVSDDGKSYDAGTMNLEDDPRSVTRTLTVHITPVNDAPIAFDRELEVDEALEYSDGTLVEPPAPAFIDLAPEEFLGGATGGPELAEPSDFTDDVDADDEFDEEQQNLRVVQFEVTDSDGLNVTIDAATNNGVELQLMTGRITFNFDTNGAYTGGAYYPNVDYNEEVPFAANEQFTYIVEDFGPTTIPGSLAATGTTEQVDYTTVGGVGSNNRSEPKTMTLVTRAKNDEPEFPAFNTVTFAEDVSEGGSTPGTVYYDVYAEALVADYDPANPMRFQDIFVSPVTALDERGDGMGVFPTQSLTYTFTSLASSSPAGMFDTLPTMDDFGVLTLTPRANAYGWAVFEVTATDDGFDYDAGTNTLVSAPRSVTRRLTINITPINDPPVSFDRDLEVFEVEEFLSPDDAESNVKAVLTLLPGDFLGSTPEDPRLAKASDFSDDAVETDEFDEDEQGLRVVEFTVTLADGTQQPINASNYVNNTPLTLESGIITFEFSPSTGEFLEGEYLPSIDVNDQLPFEPTEVFQYVVEDFGPTSIPGSDRPDPDATGSIDYTTVGGIGSNNRSQPRDMTLTVRSVNDVPEFPVFDTVTFAEDINDAGGAFNTVFYNIYGGEVIGSNNPLVHGLPEAIHPGRATALDERSVQELSYSVSVISSPSGMFASDPILDRFGVLQLQPNADAYGYAVFALTMTDDGQSYISGSIQDDPRSITRTLTVNITPVNDQPVAYDRELTVNEVEEFFPITGQPTGRVAVLDLTPETFLEGNPSDAQTADFADGVVTTNEFDEDEQDLRVVQFTVTNSSGTPTVVSRDNLNGIEIPLATGTVTFNFDASGAFVSGQYLPSVDYNQEDPFLDFERFSYIVEDFGETSIPGSDYVNGQMAPPVAGFQQADYTTVGGVGSNNRSESRRVTIRTIQVNDAPRVEFRETVDIRERDDNRGTSLTDWATRRDPAETTALDEFDRQDVFFTFKQYVSQSVPDLFRPGFTPEVSDDGTLTVYPSPDAVGTGVFVITATDRVSDTDPFTPKSTEMTVTVNVRPVNDQPRLSDIAPTGQTGSIDDAYEITSDGTLIVTMKEDNTANDGTTGTPYSIPLQATGGRPGLLDIYTPGPDNESDGTLGGNQTVELVPFTTLPTTLGGSVTYVPENGSIPASLEYTPPTNVNSLNNLPDSFTYQVIDDGTNFNIRDQILDTSPLTRTGRIQFVLNPVNDRPVFDIAQTVINVSEDANMFVRNDFAFNVFGGPTPTANDEFSLTAAQTVSFNRIEPINVTGTQAAQAFTTLPTIVPAGHLTFQAAPGVFGEFVFDIYGQDNGQGSNFGRGDLNESLARRITINVLAVNDAPIPANGTGDTTTIVSREDITLNIPVDGVINGSLLGNFIAGPESPVDGLPDENDSQTLSAVNVPLQTAMGGSLTPSPNGAGATSYVYTPPLNFVGTDQFVYEVSDGDASRTTMATISLVVTPVNDAPIISPLAPIVVEESAGTVTLPDWLGTVLVGPPGTGSGGRAVDEFDGTGTTAPQTITEYRFSYVSGDTDLLNTSAANPTGLQILSDGSLQFMTSDENSGSATYQLVAVDSGPNDSANGDVWESDPVQFTLTVADVNDLPTFTAGPTVTVLEDSGTYSQPWATDISAGPGNEGNQTVAFLVQVPAEDQDLFSVLPSIDENGVLTFSVAPDAAGSTDVTVTLQDFDNGVFAGSSQPVTLSITITDQPDLPVAVDDSFTTTEDAVLFFTIEDLLANDSDPDLSDILSFVELQTTTALGAIVNVNQTTGEISYTPMGSDTIQSLRPGETATDTFEYGLQDDSEVTSVVTANVTLTIQGRNDAPVAVDDRVFIESVGTTVLDQMRDPLFNDSDIDGTLDRTSLTIVVEPQFGTLSDDNGVLTYLPGPDFAGVDTFTYTIADDLGQASAQASVELQGRPTASDITAGTSVGRTGAIDISDSFNTAFDLDLSSILITTQPTNGGAEVVDGMIMYTPDDGYVGADFLIFTVADVNGNRSAPTRMNLNTVQSRLQNPVNFSDVNRNGEVTALDALLVINRLNEVSGNSGGENIPVTDDDFGIGTNDGVNEQFYYDQSGDGFISSLDALRVINEINAQSQTGFGEPAGEATDLLVDDFRSSAGLGASTSMAAESVDSATTKVVGSAASGSDADLIDLIASEQSNRESGESDSLETNLDAAVRELF